MPNPATTDDIASRWRPLSEQETINGETFLEDAWRMLRRRVPTLEAAIAADETGDLEAEVVRILVTAVLRVMRNPEGKRKESIDDYSWERDDSISAGLLYFTDADLDDLVTEGDGRGGAFSFDLLGADYPDARFS